MKKQRVVTPIILMLCSLPFYFFGFYSLRAESGEKILGTYGFFEIGFTKNYEGFISYFFNQGPHFISAVVGLLIVSLFMMIVYIIITASNSKTLFTKQYMVSSFIFSTLTQCFYASAVVIGVLFYSNIFHASYVLRGSGRLSFSVPIVLILHLTAFFIQFYNLIDYVADKKNENTQEDTPVSTPISLHGGMPPANAVPLPPVAVASEVAFPKRTRIRSSANSFYIIASKGEYSGGKIPLPDDKELIIGKDPSVASIVISSKYGRISRKHCGVIRKGYNFYVKDYSMNGTFVSFDGERMQSGGILNKVEAGQRFNLAKTDNEFYCQVE